MVQNLNLRSWHSLRWSRNSLLLWKPRVPPCPQNTTTALYPQPVESSVHTHTPVLYDAF